jgi:hypothetical protein
VTLWYKSVQEEKRKEIRTGKVGSNSHQRVGLLHRRMHGKFFEVVIMSLAPPESPCLCYTHAVNQRSSRKKSKDLEWAFNREGEKKRSSEVQDCIQ